MGQAEGSWSCLWAAVAAVGGGQGGWALRGWVQERESRESMQDKKVSTWGLQWAANPRGIWGYGQAVAGGSRGKISTEKPETRVEGLCRGHKVGLSGQMSVHHFGVV